MSQAGEIDVVNSNPQIPTMFVTNSGTAIPLSNILEILGAGGTTTSGAGNVITITSGTSAAETLTGNSGGPVSALANNINTVGTGSITVVGNPGAHTLTTELTGLTAHNVLVGAGTPTITNVPPSATSGIPLISNGVASDPSFGTAVVAGGGTGVTNVTPYAVLCGGTTTTSPLQSIASVGTAGQILISNGAGALPTFQAASAAGAITSITGTSGGAEVPLAGNFNILGATQAAGAVPVSVVGSANTETVTVQLSQAIASTNITNVGLSAFNSSQFAVDANGFVSVTGGVVITIDGDTGSITGTTVTIYANNAANKCGGSVLFSNSGTKSTLQLSDALNNTFLGVVSGNNTLSGADNTGVGEGSLGALTTGQVNTGLGAGSFTNLTTGQQNVGIGASALGNLVTGSYNTTLGYEAGLHYTTSDSSNICIGCNVYGTLGESNVIRIGTQGSGSGQQNTCYIAGIEGVTVSNLNYVTINTATGQLGSSAAIPMTVLSITTVAHAASPYTVLSTDQFLAVNVSGGVVEIELPNAPTSGRVIYIKDSNGAAATSNISITTVGGSVTIDGQTTYTMSTNYQSINVIFDGTNYEVF